MSEQYKGACMCGAVRFSFEGAPKFIADCVCDSCRRAHGATAVCWVGVETPRFRIESGESLVNWYRSSAPSERGFCTSCGTRMFFRSSKWPGETHMAVACIATPHQLLSASVAFKEEFPAWTSLSLNRES